MEKINSIKNDKVELARKLNSKTGRRALGKILLEGIEIINWAFEYNLPIEFIIVEEKSTEVLEKLPKSSIKVFTASAGIMKKITDTNYLIPIIAVSAKNNYKSPEAEMVIVLDNVKDLGNIGTIVRTGNAFNITNYIATQNDFEPFYRKTIESSRGKVLNSYFEVFDSVNKTIEYLHKRGFQIITTSPGGSNIQSLVKLENKPIALVIGNETSGASEELIKASDKIIQIPMSGGVESLNAGVAAGISIYELKMKWILTMLEDKIKSTLGRQVNVLSQHIRFILDLELKQVCELDSKQVVFLMVLECDKEMPIEQVIKENGLLENEFNKFITPLLEKNLVITENNKVKPTSENGNFLSKLWAIKDRAEQKILSCLTQEESKVFNELLNKLVLHCDNIINALLK